MENMTQTCANGIRRLDEVINGVLREPPFGDEVPLVEDLKTGLTAIDGPLGGLPMGETVAVAGERGDVGRLLCNVAVNFAKQRASVLYCATNDAIPFCAATMLAGEARVSLSDILNGTVSEQNTAFIEEARDVLGCLEISFMEWDPRAEDCLAKIGNPLDQEQVDASLGRGLEAQDKAMLRPAAIIIDSLPSEWYSASLENPDLIDADCRALSAMAERWNASVTLGVEASPIKYGGLFRSPLVGFVYAVVGLGTSADDPCLLGPEIYVRGRRRPASRGIMFMQRFCRAMDVIDVRKEPGFGVRKEHGLEYRGHGDEDVGCREERLLRNEIMETARPFTVPNRLINLEERAEQWEVLYQWLVDYGLKDTGLLGIDYFSLVAYELGFADEFDARYRSRGRCKAIHDREIGFIMERPELKTKALLLLLSAFSMMGELIGGSSNSRRYRIPEEETGSIVQN